MEPKSVVMKKALREGKALFGTFICLPTFHTIEVMASSSFDFLVFDAEHAPTSPSQIHLQLAALAGCKTASVVRIAAQDPVLVKSYLDLGADALMVPNVESTEQAKEIVRMMRYPPQGIRGVGGSMRATDYFRNAQGYYASANANVCLMAQIETPKGLANLDAIAAVDGVDVIFFGPNDFAANSGFLGQPGHADVMAKMEAGMRRVKELGKASGILCGEAQVDRYMKAGTQVIAVGSEVGLLVGAADGLVKRLNAMPR
ncbi:MAG: HpcH/HpaI aldolase family protein [Xanthobacteraceae bacterium]